MTSTRFIRLLFVVAALATAVSGALTAAPDARAWTECGRQLLDDWVKDQRIDARYRASCYQDALANLPDDVAYYTSAVDDIQRALNDAIRTNDNRVPEFVDPPEDQEDAVPLPGIGGGGEAGGSGGSGDDGGISLLPRANGADSVPIPLLVLAGMALFLLSAAAVTFATRRLHARRVTTAGIRPRDPRV